MINLQIPSFPKTVMKSLNCFPQYNFLTFCSAAVTGCAKARETTFSTLDVLPWQYDFAPVHRNFSEFAPLRGQRVPRPYWIWAVLALGRSLTLGEIFMPWPYLVFVHRSAEIAQPAFETNIYVHLFIYLVIFWALCNPRHYFPTLGFVCWTRKMWCLPL